MILKTKVEHATWKNVFKCVRQIKLPHLWPGAQIDLAFLKKCNITELNLGPLSNVIELGGYFLENCQGLTVLDMSPLLNLKSIRCPFLSGCSGIEQLDLSSLVHLDAFKGLYASFPDNMTNLKKLVVKPRLARLLDEMRKKNEKFFGPQKPSKTFSIEIKERKDLLL